MPNRIRPLPNPPTALRLLLLPGLWALALTRQATWLAVGLAGAVLTDVLDGQLAKRWPRFADGRFDSLTLTYSAALLYGWFKFKRVSGLHLHLGKLGGALQAVFVLHALLSGSYRPVLPYLVRRVGARRP